ncbi:hypothetical protein CBR_g31164 [Chara braunii]|uniref:Uncharacterized protein n=1 Tax=Chara braunii TaxID=69332 RepID=A0A388LEL5_CHABU|nr:hypothetical protein CBR_g31164 [Chara braunii]|eukprot:GBG80707.1 hypothetical protein CBR_g31164 [Chara braunii]
MQSKAIDKSRTCNAGGSVTVRQPRISISSDEEDTRLKIRTKHEFPTNGGDQKLDKILNLLGALAKKDSGKKEKTGEEMKEKGRKKKGKMVVEDKGKSETNKGEVTSGSVEEDDKEEKKKEGDIIEYMKLKLDYYMDISVKEVKSLCVKRGGKIGGKERKDKCAWELAKQDSELFTKLVNKEDGEEFESSEEETPDEESSGNRSDDDEESRDVAGN